MSLQRFANRFALVAMTYMLFLSSSAFAEDWPAWRGKSGSGFSHEHDVPMNWGPDLNVHWKRPVPGVGHSSPIVWNNTIVLTYADAEAESRHVMAVERETGNLLWDTVVARGAIEKMHNDNSPASATPITDGQSIYAVFCVNGNLEVSSLDLQGEVQWQTTVGSFESAHGFCTALILTDGKLILSGLQDGSDAFVAAINAKDGSNPSGLKAKDKIQSVCFFNV